MSEPALPASERPLPFANGGAIGALIREKDWSTSPVGAVADWPDELVSAVSLILPASSEIVLFWGPEHVAIYNDAYAPTIGNKHPRALGRPASESWTELWDDLEPLLRHVCETGETFSAKDRPFNIERGGYIEEVFFDVSYSAVRKAGGGNGGVLCIVSETTERVRAERTAAKGLARLSEMFEAAPSFMAVLREPGHVFELANASYRSLVGGRDVVGLTIGEALPEVAEQGFITLLDEVVTSGTAYRGSSVPVLLTRGGGEEERFLDFVYQPITDSRGMVTGIFVEGTDVTTLRREQERLQESEERFRQIADSAPALIWMSEANGRLTFANRWFEEFLGITQEEMTREGWMRIIPPEDRADVGAARNEVRDSPNGFGGELRVVTKHGDYRWVHAQGEPRYVNGVFAGHVGCAVDVTERHLAGEALERRIEERTAELSEQVAERERVEATLHQMQRLEAVGQLTSGVAHDFNNLLTVVLGNVDIVAREAEKAGMSARTMQRLDHVRTAAQRGATLTQQLLAFSRRQRLEAKAVDLNDAVLGMTELLGSTLGRAIAIETRLEARLWPALVDPTQIELIILNLAINARDAMPGGGTLTVSTDNVTRSSPERPEEPAAGDYVMVAVNDTGTGMDQGTLARAFEPFFTTKEVGKGSGLGLAQVFGFAKQSGGGVRIDTAEGEGTTVRVFLPRALEGRALEPDTATRPTAGVIAGRIVLVLDDEDAVRDVTADALRQAGCRVIEAADGASALRAIAREPGIEAVVADFAMPGMNGVEFARRAQKRRPGLPVLFVTGFADLTAIADVPEERIVRKPYERDHLIERVGAVLHAVAGTPGSA